MFSHLPYKLEPYDWQKGALERSDCTPDMALLAEMGTGKTKTGIEILRRKCSQHKRQLKTLILGPVAVIYNWKEEIHTHSYMKDEAVVVLSKSGKARVKQLLDAVVNPVTKEATNERVVITNYEALGTKDLFAILKEWQPEVIICDESHLCKNPKAIRSKRTAILADKAY